ncbi:MAG: pantetheine-phosphate adenylyltransferase [Bacteroidales bacterium]|jgi:pantetheine-phosphate adenylyltransferase|nr:pantetheine-phosphate adenylyltransferase [Bacteroidales bacterium]MBQ2376016.1 pantetheine-phosphate adenylyltransferase [Bacteroidales bacterium]MEE0917208.1 pantetheine-phosphate adenylyltransferase [Bacteroidales bacterium]MEE0926880.1 pantetheine-phosphate adenylyltransferase [Bacteroidales bacterium]MEE0983230.1 pantetheine-phosphate adenylyltransferase [Bacteroidales bacterium]
MEKKIALFPGSFDPITKGHKSIVERALPMFDKIVVAVGTNTAKNSVFPLEKRIEWIEKTFAQYDNVEVVTFNSLTVDFCREIGAKYILRGLRNSTDFQYERNIARINQELDSEIETIFLMTKPDDAAISSSLVREILSFGRDVSQFIPEEITISINDIAKK